MLLSRRGPLVAKARAEHPLQEIPPRFRPCSGSGSGQMPYPQTAGGPTRFRTKPIGLRERFDVLHNFFWTHLRAMGGQCKTQHGFEFEPR